MARLATGCLAEKDVEYVGSDIPGFARMKYFKKAEHCASRCAANTECVSWTWFSTNGECSLKHYIRSGHTAKAGAVSGLSCGEVHWATPNTQAFGKLVGVRFSDTKTSVFDPPKKLQGSVQALNTVQITCQNHNKCGCFQWEQTSESHHMKGKNIVFRERRYCYDDKYFADKVLFVFLEG